MFEGLKSRLTRRKRLEATAGGEGSDENCQNIFYEVENLRSRWFKSMPQHNRSDPPGHWIHPWCWSLRLGRYGVQKHYNRVLTALKAKYEPKAVFVGPKKIKNPEGQ